MAVCLADEFVAIMVAEVAVEIGFEKLDDAEFVKIEVAGGFAEHDLDNLFPTGKKQGLCCAGIDEADDSVNEAWLVDECLVETIMTTGFGRGGSFVDLGDGLDQIGGCDFGVNWRGRGGLGKTSEEGINNDVVMMGYGRCAVKKFCGKAGGAEEGINKGAEEGVGGKGGFGRLVEVSLVALEDRLKETEFLSNLGGVAVGVGGKHFKEGGVISSFDGTCEFGEGSTSGFTLDDAANQVGFVIVTGGLGSREGLFQKSIAVSISIGLDCP